MVNINPATGIAYGYISANTLHGDVVQSLQEGTEAHYAEAWEAHVAEKRREYDAQMADLKAAVEDDGKVFNPNDHDEFDPEEFRDAFNDDWLPDEPIHEGTHQGVKYRTSWLGGALNVFIFESPHTGRFKQCSPCVPGAADLDNPDEDGIEGYDVPPDWRDQEAQT